MAVYHKHLQYHENTVRKHRLQEEEINFLMELQKEMNTQDNVGQAEPRFWVIQGSEKHYGIETGYEDGSELVLDTDTVATDMISAARYIQEDLLAEINDTDGIQRIVELEEGIFHPTLVVKWEEDGYEDSITFDHMEGVADWLNEMGYEYRVVNYMIERKIYPNTMFLTQKAAEEHLKSNYYHYSEDAHTYAMTSWRNPETEKLWKILREIDWGKQNEKN